jgi:hypothetical protein
MKFSGRVYEFIVLLLLGLTPLLWFHNKEVVLGHDAGLPMAPVLHFGDRLFAWTARYGFGSDQTYAVPGFFIHGIEAFVSSFGASLQKEQEITFIFWFILPGITMFFFAKWLEKKLQVPYLALPAAVMYMFNHFTLQGWFIAERTKFSLYAALPLLLLLLFQWKEKKISSLLTAICISLTLFFLNGEASIPLFGGLIVTILVFIIFYFLDQFNWRALFRFIQLIVLTGIISIPLQAYWLLSYYDYVKNSYAQSVDFFGGTTGILGWINYVSENSSIINLMRLQGVPEWYQNPLHPYAAGFLHNPLLIAISVAIPIAAFIPFALYREQKTVKFILFFAFLGLFSMIFIAGSHPPFGSIYLFLVNVVPGFIAFRTPFYKFSPALWFSYAMLISFTISYLLVWLKAKNINLLKITYTCIIAAIILYSYPFLTGDFFNYMKGVRSMKNEVPSYVLSYADWSMTPERVQKRTLMLPAPNPDGKVEAYKWGYWSLAPLSTLYSNASIINDSFYLSETEKKLLQDLYQQMRDNNPSWIKIAELLHIDSVVMRNDFDWSLKDSTTQSPMTYKKALQSSDLAKIKTFGQWDVYDLHQNQSPPMTTSNSLQFFEGDSKDIGLLATLPTFSTQVPWYAASDLAENQDKLFNLESAYYIKPTCIMCNLQWKPVNSDQYIPLITRDSLFYKYIKKQEPPSTIKGKEQLTAQTYATYTNLLEFSKLIDEKKNQTSIISAGQDYNSSLDAIDNRFKEYLKNRKDTVDEDTFFEILSILRSQRKILTDIVPKIVGTYNTYDVLAVIQDGLTKTQNITDEIEKQINIPLDENTKHFVFSSRKEGQYDLYYKPNEQRRDISDVSFVLNNNKIQQILSNEQNGWYKLSNVTLKKGKQLLTVTQPIENIYGASDSGSITITAKSTGDCFVSKEIQGKAGDVVRVAFTHKRNEGNEDFFIKFTSKSVANKYLDAAEELESSAVASSYKNTYALGDNSPHVFEICNKPKSSEDAFAPSSVTLDNFSMYRLTIPEAVFVSQDQNMSPQKPLSFTQKDQTKVAVTTKDKDQIITFDQSYNQKWQTTFPHADHFIANGYENGWLLNNKNDTGEISFKPQNLVIAGFITTGLTLAAILLYLLYRGFRKYAKKNK